MTTSCEEMLRKLKRKRSSQVCLGAALGISKPSALLWFKSDLFTYGLGFLMLSMGLTLTIEDFKQVCEQLPLIDIGAMPSNSALRMSAMRSRNHHCWPGQLWKTLLGPFSECGRNGARQLKFVWRCSA